MRVFAAILLGLLAALPAAQAEIRSYAIVQDDGSLKVSGRIVRLHGIYIPQGEQFCATQVRPVECKSRAALALEQRIQSFVRCNETAAFTDGSVGAVCTVDGDGVTSPRIDLGAWLIDQGWALARPEAPFEYHARERIARERGFGVWGFQADRVIVR
jgi:endonuclease YncB( thermonuclease family)